MIVETILGALTGLFGNILTSWTNYKTQKLKNEHDEKMYDFKIQEVVANTDAAIKIAKANIEGAVEIADSQAYTKSQEVGNKNIFDASWIERLFTVEGRLRYLSIPVAVILAILLGFVDVLKGFMRPSITLYLMGITTWITFKAHEILQKTDELVNATQALQIYSEITSIVVYLTVSCVTWWFGDRRMAKFSARLQKQPSTSNVNTNTIQTIEKPEQINKPNPNSGVIPK